VEVALAIVRDEEGPDGPIGIVRAEVPFRLVELAELASGRSTAESGRYRRIAQRLRQAQVLLLRDPAELGAMLPVVLVELGSAAKAGARRPNQ